MSGNGFVCRIGTPATLVVPLPKCPTSCVRELIPIRRQELWRADDKTTPRSSSVSALSSIRINGSGKCISWAQVMPLSELRPPLHPLGKESGTPEDRQARNGNLLWVDVHRPQGGGWSGKLPTQGAQGEDHWAPWQRLKGAGSTRVIPTGISQALWERPMRPPLSGPCPFSCRRPHFAKYPHKGGTLLT